MKYFLSITLLCGLTSIVLCQRISYGRQPNYSSGPVYFRGQTQRFVPQKAVAIIQGKVSGVINFEQIAYDRVRVSGTIEGLTPGEHGFHIHQFGDLTEGCKSAGPHFNPHNREHGSPNDFNRHVGDLGNIFADESGKATLDFLDYYITLAGTNAILGRAVVVHENIDDLGRGGHEQSKSTGNAGGRLGCGVIAWAQVKNPSKA